MNQTDFDPGDFDPSLADLFDEPLDESTVVNVTSLDDLDLLNRYYDCDDQLLALKEVRFPRTEQGREIHSFRAALRVEMLRRKQLKEGT